MIVKSQPPLAILRTSALDSLVPHLLQCGRELAGVSRGWPEPTSTPGAAQAEEGRKPAWGSLCRAGLCRQKGKGNQEIGAPGGERVRKDFDFPHPRRVCTIFFFLIWKVSVRALSRLVLADPGLLCRAPGRVASEP